MLEANYLTDNSKKESSEDSDKSKDKDKEEARTTSVSKVTSRAGATSKEKVGGEKENYVVAIAAGHNNTDDTGARSGELVEEDLTIEVAEKVEELIKERFSNITVVQTGSTSSNRGGIAVDRKERN